MLLEINNRQFEAARGFGPDQSCKDFIAWSKERAAALRAATPGGSNQALDWEDLAEEIEDLGRSQRSALASHIMRVVQHLAKLKFFAAFEPRNG